MIFSGQFTISLHTTGRKTDKENEKNVMIFSGQFGISLHTTEKKNWKKGEKTEKCDDLFRPIWNLTQSEAASSSVGLSPHGRLSHEPDCTFLFSFSCPTFYNIIFFYPKFGLYSLSHEPILIPDFHTRRISQSHEPDCTFLTFSFPRFSRQKSQLSRLLGFRFYVSPMNLIAHFSILFLSRIFTNFWF